MVEKSENMKRNDPYRGMDRSSTRPEFLARSDKARERDERRGGAVADLMGAEENAARNGIGGDDVGGGSGTGIGGGVGSGSDDKSELFGVASNEEKAGGLFTGIGRDENGKKGKKQKSFLKRKGPMAAILVLVLGFGGMSFFGLTTELVAWKENIYSMFGQNSAIMSRRSNYIMRRLLATNQNTTSTNIFGGTKFKISTKLSKKLKSQGIDYVEVEDADGKPLKMLVFEDADGRYIPIVASDSDVPRANAYIASVNDTGVEIDGDMIRFADSSMTLTEARRVNADFDISYDTATLTFTGKIAGWFDKMTDSMYERLIGKNARNQTDIDDPNEESVNKMLLGNASEGVEDNDIKAVKQATDEEGNPITEDGKPVYVDANGNEVIPVSTHVDADGNEVVDATTTVAEIESGNGKVKTDTPDVEAVKSSFTARAKKVAMIGSTVGCAVLRAMGTISAAVGAVQTINAINYASKYLEMADKIKAGDADETTNIAINNLSKPVTTNLSDIDGNSVEVRGAVTEGDGWNQVFSSTNLINENDPSALLVNREYANKSALRRALNSDFLADVFGAMAGFGGGIAAFRACNAIQGIAGTVSFVADAFSLITFGISKVVKDTVKGAIEGAAFATAMITIGTIINVITPTIAHWFAGLLSDAFLGKTGGFTLLSGAQNIMNSNLQMSTGRYADKANAVEVFALMKDVEGEWARYERATRSPFDVTSKYTFLGVIYNSILPIFNKSSGAAMSTILSVASLTKDSAIALVSPSVSAASDANGFSASLASEGNCAYLDSVGIAGDFACNKYAGAYVDELEHDDPVEIYQRMKNYGSFDGEDADGNPKINVNSDYAKYIVACVTSDTQPGTMSGAVQGFITGVEKDVADVTGSVGNGLINFGRNFVPFEGFLDAVEAGEELANVKWNSGLACSGKTGDTEFDEMVKTFSEYNLDQRVLNSMGVIDSNSTVGFLEEYYEANPLDYSFEGQIARVSGLSKEEVEDTLALIDYYNYIAKYDASERYEFGGAVVKEDRNLTFGSENVMGGEYILTNNIVYADVRNRVALV